MADFRDCIGFVLKHEGANYVVDCGGPTKYGWTLSTLQKLGPEVADFDNDGDVDVDDVKAMTEERAAEMYRRYWWEQYGYGLISSNLVARKVLDLSVNMGSTQAHKILQIAVNAVAGGRVLVVDGVLGQKTLEECAKVMANSAGLQLNVLQAMRAATAQFYSELCKRNPSKYMSSYNGWMNRAFA